MAEYADAKGDEGKAKTKTPQQWQEYWTEQMGGAHKRLRQFRKQGNQVVERFLDERRGAGDNSGDGSKGLISRLNLFYTNTSTLQAMLYGNTPKIDVSREHADPDDDIARVASLMLERILQADAQPSGKNLPAVLTAALQDRLLPGLGMARVRYQMETETVQQPGPDGSVVEVEVLASEDACVDYVHWQDFLWGWARTWAEVPWIAYRSFLTKDESIKRFGAERANTLEYKNQTPSGLSKRDGNDARDQQNVTQKAEVWEIWCLYEKQVHWYSESAPMLLDVKEDPLQLEGFWPSPRPLLANATTKMLIPRADFVMSQDLYNEIDELQTRISIITRAIKVIGVYDQAAGSSVGRMLKEGMENDLIPVDNWGMFAEKGGLRGSVDWFPVDTVVGVLKTLQEVQGQKIQQLYEVTGLSDILRGGATDQYTAEGTQAMKLKMGSIRVQALQEEFARFASDLQALKAQIITKHFAPETILKQASAGFLPQPDQQLIQPAMELLKGEELKWRVDIRPESIAMVDYAQLKSERTEFLTAMATYLQSAQSMVQAVPGSLPVLLQLLQWGMAGFKGAGALEGIMDQAVQQAQQAQAQEQQQEKPPSPEQIKLETVKLQGQMQEQRGQMDLQKIQAKASSDLQTLQAKTQGELQKLMADAKRDETYQGREAMIALQEIAADLDAELKAIAASLAADMQVEAAQSEFAIAERTHEHANTMQEISAQAKARPTNGSGKPA